MTFREPKKAPYWPFEWLRDLNTWTWKYNPNLIGQDKLPAGVMPGEPVADYPRAYEYHVQFRTWTWSYNSNLIGKDQLPIGEIITDLAPGQRRPEPKQLHSWLWSYNLNLIGKDRFPPGKIVTDLAPRPYQQPAQSFVGFFPPPSPLAQPIGEIVYDLVPRAAQQPAQSWTWNYNLNLIGQDQLPVGEIVTDLPPRAPLRLSDYTWLNFLIGPITTPLNQQTDWPLPQRLEWPASLRFWTSAPPPIPVVVTAPFNQSDWPIPLVYTQAIRSWTWQYNLNLIGKDRFPPGKSIYDLSPRPYQQPALTFVGFFPPPPPIAQPPGENVTDRPALAAQRGALWDYQNLLTETLAPPAVVVNYIFRPPTYSNPRGYEYSVQLRQWFGAIPPPPPIAVNYISRPPIYANPRGPEYHVQLRQWFGAIPPTVVPKPFAQSDWPVSRAYAQPAQSWTWQYNSNLIGKDQFPVGDQITDALPQRAPQQPERTITASYNPNLVGKDRLPIRQQDWPVPIAPFIQNDLRTWIDRTKLLLLVPFRQTDWPNPRAALQPAYSWSWNYNLNLIGKDQLPVGENITDLPPQPALRQVDLSNWIKTVNLALVPPPVHPFAQFDWPNPRAPQQAALGFTASYNLNLIGKDFLPFRQQDWPNPSAPYRAPELSTWIERVKLLLPPPLRQQDWPNPRASNPIPPDFAFVFNPNLIGKDKLPIGKVLTELVPRAPLALSDLRSWVQSVNLALLQPPAALPFNQNNWPVPVGPRQPDRSFTFWPGGPYFIRRLLDVSRVGRATDANPRGHDYPISLRTGFGAMPPMAIPPPVPPPSIGVGTAIGAYPKWRRLG